MDSLLSMIASSQQAFEDNASVLLNEAGDMEEARVFRTRGRGGLIKRDKRIIRHRPHHKGLAIHTRSEHRSHGYGSFCRTHSHPTCR